MHPELATPRHRFGKVRKLKFFGVTRPARSRQECWGFEPLVVDFLIEVPSRMNYQHLPPQMNGRDPQRPQIPSPGTTRSGSQGSPTRPKSAATSARGMARGKSRARPAHQPGEDLYTPEQAQAQSAARRQTRVSLGRHLRTREKTFSRTLAQARLPMEDEVDARIQNVAAILPEIRGAHYFDPDASDGAARELHNLASWRTTMQKLGDELDCRLRNSDG